MVPAAPPRGDRGPGRDDGLDQRRAVVGAAPAQPGARHRARAGPPDRHPGDDDPPGLPGVPAAAGSGKRLPVRAVPGARVLSGAKDPSYVERFRGPTEAEQERLARRLSEPSLWDGFVHALDARGLPTGSDDELRQSLRQAAHDRATHADVWALSEAMLQHDELAASWRARHVVMVERMIGAKSGTGGSSGAAYLRGRLPMQYYPLLWELRSAL